MVKLKLTLTSKKPRTIYLSNGKIIKLHPGSNTIKLSYEDYINLTTKLSIKPVEKETLKQEVKELLETPENDTEVRDNSEEPSKENNNTVEEFNTNTLVENKIDETELVEESTSDVVDSSSETSKESTETVEETTSTEEIDKETEIDYTTMSYTQLKAEYKKVTGSGCRLKKDEIIAFLQEHKDA